MVGIFHFFQKIKLIFIQVDYFTDFIAAISNFKKLCNCVLHNICVITVSVSLNWLFPSSVRPRWPPFFLFHGVAPPTCDGTRSKFFPSILLMCLRACEVIWCLSRKENWQPSRMQWKWLLTWLYLQPARRKHRQQLATTRKLPFVFLFFFQSQNGRETTER